MSKDANEATRARANETPAAVNASGDFIVERGYSGYVFMGWAMGRFDAEMSGGGTEKRPYFNMYVISPVSSFQSEDYQASGFKAEKKSCLSSDVWNGLQPGDRVKLFFDDKRRVQMAMLDE